MKVLWTDAALSQLQAIHDYLAQTSPEYARRIVDRLTKRSIQIATFPFSGRAVPEYELNEVRQVIERSYRIIYLKLGHKSGEWQNLIVFATLWSYGYQPNSNTRLLVAFDSTGR